MGIRYCLIVTSDNVALRGAEDRVTPLAKKLLSEKGRVLVKSIVAENSLTNVIEALLSLSSRSECEVILVTGGTGPGPRDIAVHAVKMIAKPLLPGFGEEFRRMSTAKVGVRGLLSKAGSFLLPGRRPVFVTPGSPSAVKDALEIIVSLDEHLLDQLRGSRHTGPP